MAFSHGEDSNIGKGVYTWENMAVLFQRFLSKQQW